MFSSFNINGLLAAVGLGKKTRFYGLASSAPSPYISAAGGIITRDGDYLVHTFNSSGDFIVGSAGDSPFNVVEYLVIGGGASGGVSSGAIGNGGGGAGGYLTNTGMAIVATSYPVVIGAGGLSRTAGLNLNGNNGSPSSFNGIIAMGGGGGGTYPNDANSGSSGGGAGFNTLAGNGTIGQGSNGGNGSTSGSGYGGGGGGGASGSGGNGTSTNGGAGGPGILSSINGTPTFRAGGGGGGTAPDSGIGGIGGSGVGGNGQTNSLTGPGAGLPNTGSGGGAASGPGIDSGAGASGVVIIRYYKPLT